MMAANHNAASNQYGQLCRTMAK